MIQAHGCAVSVSNDAITLTPTPLHASLRGSGEDTVIPTDSVTGTTLHEGDEWAPSTLIVEAAEEQVSIPFPPGTNSAARELASLIDAARAGDAPETEAIAGAAGIPGFSFVGFDVETANPNWGSICQIGLVKVIDGEEVDRVSWLCCPPHDIAHFEPGNVAVHGINAEDVADQPGVSEFVPRMVEFVGDLPLVAHNAYFDASALRDACVRTGTEVPQMLFACTLAQARATKLDVVNHRLPTLAQRFGVELANHHDACEDAAACAGVMVGLAREANHTGSLMQFVHDTGFTLGSIDSSRVTPVLRDRSGAGRATQAKQGTVEAAVAATAKPRGSNQAGPRKKAAPWQSVATPDEIPEPNPQADPNAPLYGEHVTLTGEFEPFDKGQLWAGIADQGAQVGKNVTKKTTVLVVGEWATMTSKEKRARELMEKGQEIQIWPAEKLLGVLNLA